MPFFRVQVENAMTGRPGDIVVEASDASEARNIAAGRGYRTSSVISVESPDAVDASQVIRKRHLEEPPPIARTGPTVIQIAMGVFLGLTMFTICVAIVSCAAGGQFTIG